MSYGQHWQPCHPISYVRLHPNLSLIFVHRFNMNDAAFGANPKPIMPNMWLLNEHGFYLNDTS